APGGDEVSGAEDAPAAEEPAAQEPDATQEPSVEPGTPGPAEAPSTNGGLPQPITPPAAGPAPSGAAPLVSISGNDVVAVLDGREAWRLSFGDDSGGTSGLLQLDEQVLVGHGNHVLVIDPDTGVVSGRHRLPARVESITTRPESAGVDGAGSDGGGSDGGEL